MLWQMKQEDTLWPAVAVHAALAILLALGWLVSTRGNRTDQVAA